MDKFMNLISHIFYINKFYSIKIKKIFDFFNLI